MKVKVKRGLFYRGKRYLEGEIVDMDENLVKAFGKRYVEPLKEAKKDDSNLGRSKRVSKNK